MSRAGSWAKRYLPLPMSSTSRHREIKVLIPYQHCGHGEASDALTFSRSIFFPGGHSGILQRGEFAVSLGQDARLVLLLLQPYPFFHDNRARRLAEQEESLASVKDDDVVAVCAVRIEERPGTIRMNRVASVRCGFISPRSDYTVGASCVANEAARPISAVEGDAHLGDGATHHIVHARPAEGILPFEAGNATAGILGMDVDAGPWNAGNSRKERETCHEKKILSETAHF